MLAVFEFLFRGVHIYTRSAIFVFFYLAKSTRISERVQTHTGVAVSWERRFAASF